MSIIRSPRPLYMPSEYFSVGLAQKYGLTEAIIFSNISRLITNAQKSDDVCEVDGVTYAKCSIETLNEWMPYVSQSTLKRAIANLVKQGVFVKKMLSAKNMDTTSWYAIVSV